MHMCTVSRSQGEESRASWNISWSSEPLTPCILDVVDCADRGVIGKMMIQSGVWIFKIKQQKMESIFGSRKAGCLQELLSGSLGMRRNKLLNFQYVSLGENPNIEFSLAGEGAIRWAIRLAGEEAGAEIICSLVCTEGSSGKRRSIQDCRHPDLPKSGALH